MDFFVITVKMCVCDTFENTCMFCYKEMRFFRPDMIGLKKSQCKQFKD